MKILKSASFLLFALAFCGTARTDEAATAEEVIEIECPVAATPRERESILRSLLVNVSHCVRPSEEVVSKVKDANTTEDLRAGVKEYCDLTPRITDCIFKIKKLTTHCFGDNEEVRKFSIEANLLQLLADVSCARDGERIASIIFASRSIPDSSEYFSFAQMCLGSAGEKLDREAATVSQLSLNYFQATKNVESCISEYGTRQGMIVEDLLSIIQDVSQRINCVEEGSGNEDLCRTVVKRLCDFPTEEGREGPSILYQNIANETFYCFMEKEDKTSIFNQFKEAQTVEDYKNYFKDFCQITIDRRQCLLKNNLQGELCLHGRYLEMFRGAQNMLELFYSYSCDDKGVRISNLLGPIRSMVQDEGNFAEVCFTRGLEEGMAELGAEHVNYRRIQYNVFKNFQKCITEYGKTHSQAVVDFGDYLGEIIDHMSCREQTRGWEVPCSTLTNEL